MNPPIVVSVVATIWRVASTTISRWRITSSAIAHGSAFSRLSTTIDALMEMPSRPRPPTIALKPMGRLNSHTPKKASPMDRTPVDRISTIMRKELNTSMIAPAITRISGTPTLARLVTASAEFSASPPTTTL